MVISSYLIDWCRIVSHHAFSKSFTNSFFKRLKLWSTHFLQGIITHLNRLGRFEIFLPWAKFINMQCKSCSYRLYTFFAKADADSINAKTTYACIKLGLTGILITSFSLEEKKKICHQYMQTLVQKFFLPTVWNYLQQYSKGSSILSVLFWRLSYYKGSLLLPLILSIMELVEWDRSRKTSKSNRPQLGFHTHQLHQPYLFFTLLSHLVSNDSYL